jgi:hypothetical protein
VRPHPHIGLATVTYLFEGAIAHPERADRPPGRRELDDGRKWNRPLGAAPTSSSPSGPSASSALRHGSPFRPPTKRWRPRLHITRRARCRQTTG